MARRTTPQHGDRAVNKRTGEMGTIIDVHTQTTPKGSPPNFTVLPDTGPRRSVLWQGFEVEWDFPGPRKCYRCGETTHTVQTCDKGDVP